VTDPAAVAATIRDTHVEVVAAVERVAARVAREWPAAGPADGRRVATELEAALGAAGLFDRLPALLETATDRLGATPVADPVAAPPYVVVTSRGPVLRATLPRRRVVVTLAVVEVEDGRYRSLGKVDIRVRCPERR